MKMLSVDNVRRVQAELELGHTHVVHVCAGGFTVAHTDAERAQQDEHPLLRCRLHRWLESQDGPPVAPGLYVASGCSAGKFHEVAPL